MKLLQFKAIDKLQEIYILILALIILKIIVRVGIYFREEKIEGNRQKEERNPICLIG